MRALERVEMEELAERISSINGDLASFVRSQTTKVWETETPFFPNASIRRVQHWLVPTRTIVFTVGCAEDGTTALLPLNPDGWASIARSGVDLRTEPLRIAYLVSFLENTRSFAERFMVLYEVDQLEPRPGLSDEEAARFEDIRHRFGPLIAPTISSTAPWKATLYAVKEQDLVRYTLRLSPTGEVETTAAVVEKELPIPWAI